MGSAGPIINGASRSAQSARSSRTGGSGSSRGASGSSDGGSAGSASGASGSRGSSSRGGGGSSASSARGVKQEQRRRTCKTCPDWRYQMGIRRLGGIPLVYQYHHLFVVAWNRGGTGLMPTYSAFPSNEGGNTSILGAVSGAMQSDSSKDTEEGFDPASEPDSMGYLKYTFFADYYGSGELAPGNRFVTLRDTSRNMNPQLHAAASAIDAKRIRYVPTGPNSNSFAMSVAENAGLPRRKPSGDAPGSGMRV